MPSKTVLLVTVAGLIVATWLPATGAATPLPGPDSRPASRVQEITLAGHPFLVEIAETPAQRARGLMHRQSLPPGRGMLFRFSPAQSVGFWMENVLFPLDLLYFDDRGCLLGHHDEVPPCESRPCPVYSNTKPTSWVLELPAGTRRTLPVADGDCVLELKP
jgi:uncharacterized membrane protein (UPF0127 family)